MAELAQTVTPQGLLGVCRFVDVPLADLAAARPRLVAVLANVRDPGNAGTVLRTADAAGADGVIFTAASVDPYNSKCVRSSAGSLFHLPVVTGAEPAAAAAALRAAGLRVLAADGSADHVLDVAGRARPGRARPRGCSGTRPGACRPACWPWPTRPWPCRSTAGPRASTWPPRPPSACTPPPPASTRWPRPGPLVTGPPVTPETSLSGGYATVRVPRGIRGCRATSPAR